MLAGSARITRAPTPVPFSRNAASTSLSRLEGRPSRGVHESELCRARRHATVTRASFLDTLFSGGGTAKSGGKAEAEELVSELMGIVSRNGKRKEIRGPNEQIDELIDSIGALNAGRNAARSQLLPAVYKLAYTTQGVYGPPGADNPTLTITEDLEAKQASDFNVFGLFPSKASRMGSFKVAKPNTLQLVLDRQEVDKGFMGNKSEEMFAQFIYDIAYLDERALVVFVTKVDENGVPVTGVINQVYDRISAAGTEVEEAAVKSSISVGGLPSVNRKDSAATQAERAYQKKAVDADAVAAKKEAREEAQRLQKEKAAAEREAREEEQRLQKEKAAAEREAALALKAEIKTSVDGFSQKVKEAAEAKKEAVAALKAFERDNTGVLKEVKAFKDEMDSMTAQIEALVEETQQMAADEKGYAEELKECRREITALEQKLATL